MSLRTLETTALARLDEILAAPEGVRVGVLGLGVVGKAMTRHLLKRGAFVLGVDQHGGWKDDSFANDLSDGGQLHLGPIGEGVFDDVELLVLSPGVDPRQPAVQAVWSAGKPVIGELELLGELPARVVGITGTNGKSTTTALLGGIVASVVENVFVGGNLGIPITTWISDAEETDVAVLELSSYQLETAYRFSPEVAILLNITPDHTERYDNHAEYAVAKRGLLENLSEDAVAILNYDDALVRDMATHTRARVVWFSLKDSLEGRDGVFVAGDSLVGSGCFESHKPVALEHPRLFGWHNRQNALAAFLAADALGLNEAQDWQQIREGYVAFTGLEHRLELVANLNGVRFINDSKATNDSAAAVAVRAIDRPVLLLAGGRGKGAGYGELLAASINKVRHVVAFGEAGDEVAQTFFNESEQVGAGVSRCTDLREAFEEASFLALPGDVVLLAPACASFDEFSSYAARGRAFKKLVSELAAGGVC